jgi:hypothetical protein
LMATSARYRDLVKHQLVDAEGEASGALAA